jgi:hypothetical protein
MARGGPVLNEGRQWPLPELWPKVLQYFSAFEARMLMCTCKFITSFGQGGVVRFKAGQGGVAQSNAMAFDFWWIVPCRYQVEVMMEYAVIDRLMPVPTHLTPNLSYKDNKKMVWFKQCGNTTRPTRDVAMLWFKEFVNHVLRSTVKCKHVDIDPVYLLPLYDLYQLFHGFRSGGSTWREDRHAPDNYIDVHDNSVTQPDFTHRICELSTLPHWKALQGMPSCLWFDDVKPLDFYGDFTKPWRPVLTLMWIIGLEPTSFTGTEYDLTTVDPHKISAFKWVDNNEQGFLVHAWHNLERMQHSPADVVYAMKKWWDNVDYHMDLDEDEYYSGT